MGPGVDGAMTPFVVGMEEGEYMVTVTINDKHCYTLCDTVNISRLQEPTATIAVDFSQYCTEGVVLLSSQFSGVLPIESTVWSTGEESQLISVEEEGNYTFTIVDACMETAVASADVVFPDNEFVQWPKVFFPRGEEQANQTFGPYIDEECNPEITDYTLKIYNRWGNEVFSSNDINDEWDGQHGGTESASAVYVWVAE